MDYEIVGYVRGKIGEEAVHVVTGLRLGILMVILLLVAKIVSRRDTFLSNVYV